MSEGHEKVFGICENKCMVEVEPKSRYFKSFKIKLHHGNWTQEPNESWAKYKSDETNPRFTVKLLWNDLPDDFYLPIGGQLHVMLPYVHTRYIGSQPFQDDYIYCETLNLHMDEISTMFEDDYPYDRYLEFKSNEITSDNKSEIFNHDDAISIAEILYVSKQDVDA